MKRKGCSSRVFAFAVVIAVLYILLRVAGGKVMENEEWVESPEFFNLLYHYRHAPIDDHVAVTKALHAVKQYIRDHMKVKG